MTQSKRMSLAEAITGTLLGMVLAFLVNLVLMHATGVHATAMQNLLIVAGHTVVSVVRGYAVRRFFAVHATKVQAWWILRRPGLVRLVNRMIEAQLKYRWGRKF